ncbi:MAG TPA: hypothetical protein VK213_04745 [Bacteroidales bacterium]|nr:hypothetical protein [Bacteroidales bacterium]
MKKFCILLLMVIPLHCMAQPTSGKYLIKNEIVNTKPVSPWIYGHFIELGFGRQIEGMWAEKLYNPGFEIVEPFKAATWGWLGRTASDDLTKEEWWHSGYEECKWYATLQDGTPIPLSYSRYSGFFQGLQAIVLDNRQNKNRAYLAQDSVWIKKGINNKFTGYMKVNRPRSTAGSPEVPSSPVNVVVGLYKDRDFLHPIIEKSVQVKETFYDDFELILENVNYSGRATFAVSIDPQSSVSFDGFSLMPDDAVKGWRKDVIYSLKEIGVPIIRFPGGCFDSFYHWRDAVGPKSDRMPVNSEYWGDIEENNVGTAEFVELCRLIGSEPFIGVNMLTGTAEEAADWVAYNNKASGDRMSQMRIAHGYTEPLTVKYWELDNETSRRWGYEDYANKCVEFSKAMKAVDPDIQLVMVYYSFRGRLKEMLEIAGKHIDLVTDRSGTESVLREDMDLINEYNRKNGTSIRLCNTEWLAPRVGYGSAASLLDQRQTVTRLTRQQHQISWNYAMNTALQLLTFQRLGNDFLWSNFNNLANTWGQNIIECPKDTVFISAAGRVFQLMSRSESAWVLKSDTINGDNGLIMQATTNETKDKLIVYVLNYHPSVSKINLDLTDFKSAAKDAIVKTVSSEGPFISNTSRGYDKIVSSIQTVRLNSLSKPTLQVQPWSVNEITIKL